MSALVSIIKTKPTYPTEVPYNPHSNYKEFDKFSIKCCNYQNNVYESLRELLILLFGKPSLDSIVKPGDTVVLKPNLVKESKDNPLPPVAEVAILLGKGEEGDDSEWESVITHGSIIRAICDYVCLALHGKGRVVICDGPQTDSSFTKISERAGLNEIAYECERWSGVDVQVVDLRNEEWINEEGIIVSRKKLKGDPGGTVAFNLGKDSFFYGYKGEGRYYGADYDMGATNEHHKGEIQEYLLCHTPIKADVFINIPKLKTHKKAGVTLNLKNLVGINADKNWLPHHTEGCPKNGGDQFPELTIKQITENKCVHLARKIALKLPLAGPTLTKKLRKMGKKAFGDGDTIIRSGNWYGNDTTWRMALDLNKCLFYGGPTGKLSPALKNRKRFFSVIDGIIGMEGNGPMHGDAVQCGVLIGGVDAVVVDAVAATVMGFDWRKLKIIKEAFEMESFRLSDYNSGDVIQIVSNVEEWNATIKTLQLNPPFRFKPHFGWHGAIEL